MKLKVYNQEGKLTNREIELSDDIFGLDPNDHVIYLAVKQYLANQRQGTHKAKERNEVAGSTRKIKKQKGTGGARAGDIKNPLFRGGGRIFGPRPRDYGFKLNRKVKQLARNSALSHKAKNEKLLVVEDLKFDAPKTKSFIQVLNNLGINGKKSLLVTGEPNSNVYLSVRNLAKACVTPFAQLNTYDIMNADVLVLTEGTLEKFNQNNNQ